MENPKISISGKGLYPGGPNEHYGTHEKLSWGVQGR